MSTEKKHNWTSLAAELGMSCRLLKLNCKAIMPKLNKCVKRENYRNLTPKQIGIIKEHIGE